MNKYTHHDSLVFGKLYELHKQYENNPPNILIVMFLGKINSRYKFLMPSGIIEWIEVPYNFAFQEIEIENDGYNIF